MAQAHQSCRGVPRSLNHWFLSLLRRSVLDSKVDRHGAGSKTKFVRALADLQRQGVLAGPQINESSCRRQVRATAAAHANAITLYGTVVQHSDVGVTGASDTTVNYS